MPAATLLCDTSAPVAPVVPLEVSYAVTVAGFPIPGAIVQFIDFPCPNTIGGCDIVFPRHLTVDDTTFEHPALDHLAVARRVEVWRDGLDRVFAGPLTQPPDIDYLAGWVTLHCKDEPEHANHTNHGVGRNTGWVDSSPPKDPGNPTDPDDPLVTGWTFLNAVGGTVSSPWGSAISVGYGPDHGAAHGLEDRTHTLAEAQAARLHAAVHTFDLGEYDRLELNAIAKPAKGSSKVKFITMNRVNPDLPKVHQDVSVSMPSLADDKWSDPFGLTTVEGPGKVNVAIWSPMPGRHFNAVAIRYKITKTKDAPEDPTQPTDPIRVPVGGTATGMKARLYAAAFAASNSGAFVTDHGGGYSFTDGMAIEVDNTSQYGSLAQQWDSTAETLWEASTLTLGCYTRYAAGALRPELRVLVEGQARAHATAMTGGQDVPVQRNTVNASADNASYTFTFVNPDPTRPAWDRVESAPTGMSPADFAQLLDAEVSTAQPVTVALTTPPDGRTPGDWLRLGLRGGDRVPVDIPAGPWSNHDQLRIVGLRLEPPKGDSLTPQLAPA